MLYISTWAIFPGKTLAKIGILEGGLSGEKTNQWKVVEA